MGKPSRDKGRRYELEVCDFFHSLGFRAERVPDSGASGYQGRKADVDAYLGGPKAAPTIFECKRRAALPKFLTDLLVDNDALALREDRGSHVFVFTETALRRLLKCPSPR